MRIIAHDEGGQTSTVRSPNMHIPNKNNTAEAKTYSKVEYQIDRPVFSEYTYRLDDSQYGLLPARTQAGFRAQVAEDKSQVKEGNGYGQCEIAAEWPGI